jgi:hypothetical protein
MSSLLLDFSSYSCTLREFLHLFADGTFQYCPKYFYQLYTIHAFKNGQSMCGVCFFFFRIKQRKFIAICFNILLRTLDFYIQQPNQGSALSSTKIVKGQTDILLYQFLAILLGQWAVCAVCFIFFFRIKQRKLIAICFDILLNAVLIYS